MLSQLLAAPDAAANEAAEAAGRWSEFNGEGLGGLLLERQATKLTVNDGLGAAAVLLQAGC